MTVTYARESTSGELNTRLLGASLTGAEGRALAAYLAALQDRFGALLAEVVLYGSAARRQARFESDVDLLVVLNREVERAVQEQISALAHTPELDYSVVLNPLVLTPSQYHWHREGSPLWHNIRRDGIWLIGVPSPSVYATPGGKPLEEKRRELIALYMEHSTTCLRSAETLLDARMDIRTIPECYYAIFYAASAVLLSQGIERRKHSGVRSVFSERFVKQGEFSEAMGDLFKVLQKEREDADYKMIYRPGEGIAEQRLEQAKEFVETIRTYLRQRGFLNE